MPSLPPSAAGQDSLNRGAVLAWLSQYPTEREIVCGPGLAEPMWAKAFGMEIKQRE